MQVDFGQVITDLEGEPVVEKTRNEDSTRGKDKKLTLREVCINSLLISRQGDTADGKEKFARFELAKKISDGDTVELVAEEIAKIKKLIGLLYLNALVVGRAFEMLEGKATEKPARKEPKKKK